MRILHLLPSLIGGGAERQMTYLVSEQARLGHEVTVGYVHDDPIPIAQPEVCWERMPSSSNYDPRLLATTLGLIRRTRPDLVQTWILQMDVFGGCATRLTRTPWIVREPVVPSFYGRTWKFRLRATLLRRCDALVCNSYTADAEWSRVGIPAPRYVVPNALPLERIEKARPHARGELGVPPDGKLILYAGRLILHQKNLLNLIDALRIVLDSTPDRAILCGEGPDRQELERRIGEAGLADRIALVGYVDDVWSYMKAADLFVSVSLAEGRPNTVMEAMACGCPIVVSDIPSHREFLSEESARFAPTDDVRGIARAMRDSLAGEGTRARAAAAKQVTRAWSPSEMANSYERVYRECLMRRDRSAA